MVTTRLRGKGLVVGLAPLALGLGCAQILGLSPDDTDPAPAGGRGGGGAPASSTSSSGDGHAGGSGGSSARCGDDIKNQTDEECDGTDLNGMTCADHGYSNTVGLACTSACKLDATGCKPTCDGVKREPGEDCDGADLGKHDCTELGYSNPAGETCDSTTCKIDPNGCAPTCNDGKLEPGEPCDGTMFAVGIDCAAYGYKDPNGLKCDPNCQVDPSGCHAVCGNSAKEGAEACDDGNTASGDGCSDKCHVEPGFICDGAPSVCERSTRINELFYDPFLFGNDVGCYLELKGDPGLILNGYSIVAHDSANVIVFSIDLIGSIGASGYFVVSQDGTVGVLPGAGKQIDASLDPPDYNGDVALGYDAGSGWVVVDALGYGAMSKNAETSPAKSVGGLSISLSRKGSDTDDNANDFGCGDKTPGGQNVLLTTCP